MPKLWYKGDSEVDKGPAITMNNSHEKLKVGQKSSRAGDESTFDTRKIKKERNDTVTQENGVHVNNGSIEMSTAVVLVSETSETASRMEHQRNNAGSRLGNGFHANDVLQDIIASKFASVNSYGLGPAAKNDKTRAMIEDSISDESKSRVQEIFVQVEQLKIEEKLLLYLKLPSSLSNTGSTVDPLRQPLNPLGNRYEIHQTIMWIRTHLEEDPDVSLPKQEVYDEYNMFCIKNSMKPLSTADFGKVMKQVYPRVRPRRLGTRGNSRYCYAGMRKRIKLSVPTLPTIADKQSEDDFEENITEEMLGAASELIREWAENRLGQKFPTLNALARHLVENLYVCTRSLAAVCILSASPNESSTNKAPEPPNSSVASPVKPIKLREAQLQLQKKLQQREQIQKHRNSESSSQLPSKDVKSSAEACVKTSGGPRVCKKTKTTQSPQTTTSSTPKPSSLLSSNRSRRLPRSASQPSTVSPHENCDTSTPRPDEHLKNGISLRSMTPNNINHTKVSVKNPRKRASLDQTRTNTETSPEKQAKLENSHEIISETSQIVSKPSTRSAKISVIPPATLKVSKVENVINLPSIKPQESSSITDITKSSTTDDQSNVLTAIQDDTTILTKNQSRLFQENPVFLHEKHENLGTIDPDALDDYLNGGNNSQEPEEELLQYFQQSSSAETEINDDIIVACDTDQASRSDKVSQLRLILQQNLKGTVRPTTEPVPNLNSQQIPSVEKNDVTHQKHEIILPTLLNHQNQGNTRRRVSFETNVVEHSQEGSNTCQAINNTVPQSPNTRRRIFNFTPISPGPQSPINGRAASKPNSANASPFVSPRNTPVPRSRSNMAGVCRSRSSQKNFSRSISCSAPFIGKNDTFIVPGSNNETCKVLTTTAAAIATTTITTTTTTSSPLGCPKKTGDIKVNIRTMRLTDKTNLCPSFLVSDVNPQEQLLINYPSQENLQEIKNIYKRNQPADQEISDLFSDVKTFSNENYYRSQSVPLHRMVNPSLMSPISSVPQNFTHYQPFNLSSSGSSIAPTPVPSEFNDFGSIGGPGDPYLLDEVEANFIADDQQFLMEDKEITSENINKILHFLDEEDGKGLNILPEVNNDDALIDDNALMMDALPNSMVIDPSKVLASTVIETIIQSRSYPNTPLPQTSGGTFSDLSAFVEDSNGSRSYPSTPLQHPNGQDSVYRETNEPMLSSPTLNSLNLRGEAVNPDTSDGVCRNVSDLLEGNFLGDADGDATDDLDPLSNFDGLQDVDSLAPLFNDVHESNR